MQEREHAGPMEQRLLRSCLKFQVVEFGGIVVHHDPRGGVDRVEIVANRFAGERTKTEHAEEAGLGQCFARPNPMTKAGEGLQASRLRRPNPRPQPITQPGEELRGSG